MKRVIVLFAALGVAHLSAQEKMEKEQPIDKSQVTTKEAISLLEIKSTQESAEIKKVILNLKQIRMRRKLLKH